jgi:osmotically-inducible protein OsmY
MRLLRISLVLLLLTSGCNKRDGDILAEVCRKTGHKVEAVMGASPVNLAGNLSLGEASIAVRVYNRIHWDRYLSGVQVRIQTTAPGTVTLLGHVPDLSIKQRIIDLAKSTIGVQQVEDKLTLPAEE